MSLPVAILIEDDPPIRRFVRAALEIEGWQVYEANTAQAGLAAAGTRKPDLLIVDLGLPDGDGLDLIRDIHAWSTAPILVLSARCDEDNKIAALDAGADDYLTKPFGLGELLARIRANVRRQRLLVGEATTGCNGIAGPIFKYGDIEVNRQARSVHRAGCEVHLTPLEYRLLLTLIANAGRVMTHKQLLREVWGPSHSEQNHYLRIYMGHLRHKLENDPTQPRHLLTEIAVGYRLLSD